MKLSNQAKLRATSECLSSKFESDIFLLALNRSEYFRLNPVAARTWELLADQPTFGELCSRLMEEFDVDEETCRDDVQNLLEAMLATQLIEIEGVVPDAGRGKTGG
jgi:hypothetical protein